MSTITTSQNVLFASAKARDAISFGFSVGSDGDVCGGNGEDVIAYCFASIQGYSKIGSYTGNGNADGPFIYTGFKPAFLIFKRTDAANNWGMIDSKRDPYNVTGNELYADLSQAESTGNTAVDFLSNGFKVRTSAARLNASGGTYIYMAFADQSLVGTNNVIALAR